MSRYSILIALLLALLAASPQVAAQRCEHFDPHGEVGVYEGDPYVRYVVLDCAMTPIIIEADTSSD